MELFEQLTRAASELSERDFVQQHNRLYLYGRLPESSALMGFGTFVTGPTFSDLPSRKSAHRSVTPFVESVAKSGRNDWKRRISVGRSSNNDIIFRHESVSKLHAYFYVRVSRQKLRKVEELVLVDANSANGTLRNGLTVRQEPERAKALSIGDRLAFGEVDCEYCDAATVYRYLKRGVSDF